VGVNDLQNETADVSVFPNPSSANFNLMFGKNYKGNADISITNSLGQLVYKTTSVNPQGKIIVIDKKLASGAYIAHINSGNSITRIKLVKK
jgi:hypothetical protein